MDFVGVDVILKSLYNRHIYEVELLTQLWSYNYSQKHTQLHNAVKLAHWMRNNAALAAPSAEEHISFSS